MSFKEPGGYGGDARRRRRRISLLPEVLPFDAPRALAEAAQHWDNPAVLSKKVSELIENLSPDTTRRPASPSAAEFAHRTARSTLVKELKSLNVELRSQNFPAAARQRVFAGAFRPGEATESHPGERAVSLGFEIASLLSLRDAGAEAWASKALSEATRDSSREIKAAVKVTQYLLGPSLLTIANDLTRILGEAVAGINALRLQECVKNVSQAASELRAHPAPPGDLPTLPSSVSPPSPHPLPEPPSSDKGKDPPSTPGPPDAF
ncbi:hypothetical protein [Streptomyces sp. NPDC057257]|uniref:hypothetical protein n=1 Tax=Streptomyces sp. NPDC057257 TaxID=3346071 RepID=UPI00363C1F11